MVLALSVHFNSDYSVVLASLQIPALPETKKIKSQQTNKQTKKNPFYQFFCQIPPHRLKTQHNTKTSPLFTEDGVGVNYIHWSVFTLLKKQKQKKHKKARS